jgi:hypothetical protein
MLAIVMHNLMTGKQIVMPQACMPKDEWDRRVRHTKIEAPSDGSLQTLPRTLDDIAAWT